MDEWDNIFPLAASTLKIECALFSALRQQLALKAKGPTISKMEKRNETERSCKLRPAEPLSRSGSAGENTCPIGQCRRKKITQALSPRLRPGAERGVWHGVSQRRRAAGDCRRKAGKAGKAGKGKEKRKERKCYKAAIRTFQLPPPPARDFASAHVTLGIYYISYTIQLLGE